MELNKTENNVDFIMEIYKAKVEKCESALAKEWIEVAYRCGINVVDATYNHLNPEIRENHYFCGWVARQSVALLLTKPVVIKNYKANK